MSEFGQLGNLSDFDRDTEGKASPQAKKQRMAYEYVHVEDFESLQQLQNRNLRKVLEIFLEMSWSESHCWFHVLKKIKEKLLEVVDNPAG